MTSPSIPPASLFEKQHVLFAYLFGSRARGDAKNDSDYDIAVYFTNSLDSEACARQEASLLADLQEFFQRKDIDIINLQSIDNEILKYDVFTQGKLIFDHNTDLRLEKSLPLIMKAKDFMEYRGRIISFDGMSCIRSNSP